MNPRDIRRIAPFRFADLNKLITHLVNISP
jgi:hypothetical protein